MDERIALQAMIGMGLPKSYIAVILGKHQSSVYRELNRNSDCCIYTGNEAQQVAEKRRWETKTSPKSDDQVLMSEVFSLFKKDLSPDQISGRLREQYPDQAEKQVSVKTIYEYLYRQTAQNKDLKQHFRQKHWKRHKRSTGKDRRGQIIDRVSIEKRPEIVDQKIRVGDWEGDTIESAGKNAYVATFVDKTTKFLTAKVMQNKSAQTLNKAAIRAFRNIPAACRATLTLDNGKEFAEHKALAAALGLDIYFAHPYHSWERGLNEHTNGLLRQYLPKKVSFEGLTQKHLDKIVFKINNRPRKVLNYRTPYEVFSEFI
jgi:IS30 family transposase